jgi:hypothetical protein
MYQPVRELGPIIDALEFDIPENILKTHAPKNYAPRRVSASKIKECGRQLYFSLNPETYPLAREETKEEWQVAAAQGTYLHDFLQRALMDYDLIKRPEAYLPKNDHFTSGRIDGELAARRALLEIKTVNDRAWSKMPDDPKFAGYIDQIQLYLEELDLPEALLICVRRDTIVEKPRPEDRRKLRQSLCKEFRVLRDRDHGQALIDKALGIKEALDRRIIPAAEPGNCRFCAWKHVCDLVDLDEAIDEETAGGSK